MVPIRSACGPTCIRTPPKSAPTRFSSPAVPAAKSWCGRCSRRTTRKGQWAASPGTLTVQSSARRRMTISAALRQPNPGSLFRRCPCLATLVLCILMFRSATNAACGVPAIRLKTTENRLLRRSEMAKVQGIAIQTSGALLSVARHHVLDRARSGGIPAFSSGFPTLTAHRRAARARRTRAGAPWASTSGGTTARGGAVALS
jgi:hypothetical protein